MSIPTDTTVLVIGGGPGGSYTAAMLAREGIKTVLLEADVFPRYHIGESLVASIRHFLKLVGLDEEFNAYGFVKKTGAAFKLNQAQKHTFTDFTVAGKYDVYGWNVIRSEADHIFFKHAGKSGGQVFDGTKVSELKFVSLEDGSESASGASGRPVSATWTRKDGSSGEIKFDYLVDASGRAGIMSTKYWKNRVYNAKLRNIAMWGYFQGAIHYGLGTPEEGQPFFEAFPDGSGWTWFIPLHDNTVSVGCVVEEERFTERKKASTDSSRDFYLKTVDKLNGISKLLANAKLVSDIKQASDRSYNAEKYASPYVRVVGDAGAFIDPLFSSGVHLALSSALSAAVTISASIRGDCNESEASTWHGNGVNDRFTRFLLVVLGASRQIQAKDVPILNKNGDNGFDEAFHIIRPIIQGIADVKEADVTDEDLARAVNFANQAVQRSEANSTTTNGTSSNGTDGHAHSKVDIPMTGEIPKPELQMGEAMVLSMVQDVMDDFNSIGVQHGMCANLTRGELGLRKTKPVPRADYTKLMPNMYSH